MEYFHGTTQFTLSGPTAVTLGKFDGIHRGHQKLFNHILALKEQGLQSVCFALNAGDGAQLFTAKERLEAVEAFGFSCLIECPFVPEISGMSPEEFAREVLMKRLAAKVVAVGTDFRFGYQRAGDAYLLKSLGERCGFQTDILEKERYEGREISSTYVREALEDGQMELVRELLGRPFSVSGTVQHGMQLGRTLGIPTVNLIPPAGKLLPPNGVYASRTIIDGVSYPGITNVGYKPTVSGKFRGVETHLFDVDLDLYGVSIVTELYRFERPERKFPSPEDLREQLLRDISFGKGYFGG